MTDQTKPFYRVVQMSEPTNISILSTRDGDAAILNQTTVTLLNGELVITFNGVGVDGVGVERNRNAQIKLSRPDAERLVATMREALRSTEPPHSYADNGQGRCVICKEFGVWGSYDRSNPSSQRLVHPLDARIVA